MTIDETYNIHKIINCIFPHFKSKYLCKKEIHNYRLNPTKTVIAKTYTERNDMSDYEITKATSYQTIDETNLKCFCCGRKEKLDE